MERSRGLSEEIRPEKEKDGKPKPNERESQTDIWRRKWKKGRTQMIPV